MRVFAFIPALVIGIIWLINIIRYFNYLNRDSQFMSGLKAKYKKDVMPRKGLFVRRGFRTFMLVASVALCFTLDFRVENKDVLPDILAAVLFMFAFLFFQKHIGVKKRSWLISTLSYAYISVVVSVCEGRFFEKYYYGAIDRNIGAQSLYTVIIALNIVKALIFLMLVFDICKVLFKTIRNHTGYVAGMRHSGNTENKMITELQKELKKGVIYAAVAAVIYTLSDVVFCFLAPTNNFIGVVNVLFALICIGLFIKSFFAIRHAVDTKYMLD